MEDIHAIMAMTNKPPKAQLMATYYEKLSQIFWVSKNYLFHAYAWYRFFSLSEKQNKALTEEEKAATAHILATFFDPLKGDETWEGVETEKYFRKLKAAQEKAAQKAAT